MTRSNASNVTGGFRLATGGQIDRSRPLSFTFDGRRLTGQAGDTLASALIASGVRLVGRSFKYHRPRGLMAAGPEEPNGLVEIGRGNRREPNTRATTVELYEGLEATSQNRWPSLQYDLLSLNGLAAPLLSAGFYYKTFMWPAHFWERLYEPLIRRAAGLGRAAEGADPEHYEKAFAHCDLLVIGGGPAGLAAALAAGRAGLRVILADEDYKMGGRLLSDQQNIDGEPAANWVAAAVQELSTLDTVSLMPRTTVFGVYDGGTYGAVQRVNDHTAIPPPFQPRHRGWRIFAKRCVLAAGALERPLVFGGNDTPGVMLAGAARTYLHRYAVTPGRRLTVFTSCDDGWRSAHAAVKAGLAVEAVIDSRRDVATRLAEPLVGHGARVFFGATVCKVFDATNLRGIEVRDGRGRVTTIFCDALLMSNGWSPTIHLSCHLGGRPTWDDAKAAFVPGILPSGMLAVGACAGDMALGRSLATGRAAGEKIALDLGRRLSPVAPPQADDEPVLVTPLWHVADSVGPAFVDFQNDVTAKDLFQSVQEGFGAPELAKRYTTLGMATDQGKTANVNGLALLASARGTSIAELGTTVYRPPYTPVSFGALTGHSKGKDFRPTRLSPAHAWAQARGAVFVEAGAWLRPAYFPIRGESDWLTSAVRETKATRTAVGVCDVSTLGKIDIQGPDAARFLDRIYCNTFSTLPVGRARYGLMLREDGFVMDDGTTSRLGPEHFVMTTTTAKASPVMQHLEFCHQCLWPDLDVQMVSVSDQWAQFSVAGPRARDLLLRLVDRQHDISNAAFPYLTARDITVLGGTPARLFRISFSGELGYELAVPARFGVAMAEHIMVAGGDYGVTPYGLETLNIMRIEKGHVTGGELNGQTTARDIGLGKMMSKKKDYIGRTLAGRPALLAEDRWELVGLTTTDRTQRLRSGAHLIAPGKEAEAANDLGYITSATYSPTRDAWIALALLQRGGRRHGEKLRSVDLLRHEDVEVVVGTTVMYDPQGVRLHG